MGEETKKQPIIITRKIQIRVNESDKNKKDDFYQRLRAINQLVMRMANTAATHLYVQKNLDEFEYINNDFLKHSIEIFKEGKGMSPNNRTYRVLAEKYGEDLKGLSDITTNLNSVLVQTFKKEGKEYFTGKRSLRTYRKDIPIPFSSSSIIEINKTEDKKDYYFNLFKIPFATVFGRDSSDNRQMFERSMGGDYKFCNSSIQFKKNKLYLLAVFQFEPDTQPLDYNNIAEAFLSTEYPIIFRNNLSEYTIGNKEEYEYRRKAIQASLRRHRIAAKYNTGGRGRKKKLANCDRFEEKEKNYVQTKQHTYAKMLIDHCLKQKCGTLILRLSEKFTPPEGLTKEEYSKWKEENIPLFRDWGYLGLTSKIKHKCDKVGIKLIVENGKSEESKEQKLPKKQPIRQNLPNKSRSSRRVAQDIS